MRKANSYTAGVLMALALFVLAACGGAESDNAALPSSAPAGALVTVASAGTDDVFTAGTAVSVTVEPAGTAAAIETPPTGTAVLTDPPPTVAPPTVAPQPPPAGPGPSTQKYRLLAEFNDLFFCDPDYYPVAVADETALALARFPDIEADQEVFAAILTHLGLTGSSFSDDEKLLIYQEYKRLAAVLLEPAAAGYGFQLQVQDRDGQGFIVTGTIDNQGTIVVAGREPFMATCPICLAAWTLIDTPAGPVPITELRVGDLVWTVDAAGARQAMPLRRTGQMPAAAGHELIHLVLNDGRQVWASPGHPTATGQPLAALTAGKWLDNGQIVVVERVAYSGAATFDILSAGSTGHYWANGVLMGSTLRE